MSTARMPRDRDEGLKTIEVIQARINAIDAYATALARRLEDDGLSWSVVLGHIEDLYQALDPAITKVRMNDR